MGSEDPRCIDSEVVCVDRVAIPALHRQRRVAGGVDAREAQQLRIHRLDLIGERGGEAQRLDVKAHLVRVNPVDVAGVTVTRVDEKLRRQRVNVIDGRAPIIAVEPVAHGTRVPLILIAKIARPVDSHEETLFVGDIVIDADNVVVESVV